jgi:hypothetical protein
MAMAELKYVALERVRPGRPVDRLTYLSGAVARKSCLDLGALDETAYASKKGSENWLHARLCESAASVIGVDNSPLVPPEGITTHEGGRIERGDITNLAPLLDRFGIPDIIVAGELIEHLADTRSFLESLASNPALTGRTFVFSTPNACCWHNVALGVFGRETMHPDHLQVYSFKTLQTLFARAGMVLEDLRPTYSRYPEMMAESTGPKRIAVRGFQAGINALEYCVPLLSGGWVGTARL